MPYIVTTTTPDGSVYAEPGRPYQRTRRAVATLDGARKAAVDAVPTGRFNAPFSGGSVAWRNHAACLPESGGTVGPLPDGTVIEVEAIEWPLLAERAYVNGGWSMKPAEILDAYNAARGVTA